MREHSSNKACTGGLDAGTGAVPSPPDAAVAVLQAVGTAQCIQGMVLASAAIPGAHLSRLGRRCRRPAGGLEVDAALATNSTPKP